jgi:hypothetical protein
VKALPRLVVLLGLGLSLASGAGARDRWIHARTEHFEMFSSVSEDESRDLLASLEQFRATVLSICSLPRLRDPRTTVFVFASDHQFEPYKPLYNGRPKDAAGYCAGWSDETAIALAADNPFSVTGEIIYHEYVHLLFSAGDDHPPLWLNEGLAELFSTFAIQKDSVELGRQKPDHVDTLHLHHLMPLGSLFAVTIQSPSYNEGIRQNIFYAESWVFVHFLVCGANRATYLPELRRFKELLAAPNRAIDESFREAFGMSYEGMEAHLNDYLRSGHYFIQHAKLPLGDLARQIKFQPADDFERETALLNLRWRVRQEGSTTYQLLQLAESHPRSPRPQELLAAVAMMGGDSEGALIHWRRAADLGSDNAYIYWRLARDNLDQVMNGLSLDYRMPAELAARLRGWLDRAVALSPNYLDAYEALGYVEALAERPRVEVVNRVQAVLPRMKDKTRTLLAIAIIRWRMQDYVTARQIAIYLTASPGIPADVCRRAQRLSARIPEATEPPAAPKPGASAEPATAR